MKALIVTVVALISVTGCASPQRAVHAASHRSDCAVDDISIVDSGSTSAVPVPPNGDGWNFLRSLVAGSA